MLPSDTVCFVCLKTYEILIKVQKGTSSVFKQAQYVIPELDQLKADTELRICTSCHDSLVTFYKFKKKCAANINRLKTYYILTTPDGTEHQIKQECIIQTTDFPPEQQQPQQPSSSTPAEGTTKQSSAPAPRVEIRASDVSSDETETVKTTKKRHFIRNECFQCIKRFYSTLELKKHMKKHGNESHTCTHCNTMFVTENQMVNHMNIHISNKQFCCTECDKVFVNKQHFLEHIRTHYCEKQHRCSICEKKFISKHILYKHFLIHTRSIYRSK